MGLCNLTSVILRERLFQWNRFCKNNISQFTSFGRTFAIRWEIHKSEDFSIKWDVSGHVMQLEKIFSK